MPATPQSKRRTGAPSVLIADSEPNVCRVFEARLTRNDAYDVRTATSRTEAYQAVIDRPYDVILWDMRLRDTQVLLPWVRAVCPAGRLLLMTTDDRPSLDSDSDRLDVADVLVKPLGLDDLEQRVVRALMQMHPPIPTGRVELTAPGQRVHIAGAFGQGETRVLESSPNTFVVTGPPRADLGVASAGDAVNVVVHGSDALYRFDSRIVRTLTEPVPCWEIAMPATIQREQRRGAPRFAERVQVRITYDEANETDIQTVDLSMSGLAYVSTEPVKVGTGAHVRFMAVQKAIDARAVVVRCEETAPDGTAGYRVAVHFTDQSDASRDNLAWMLAGFRRPGV